MDTFTLEAQVRPLTEKAKILRRQSQIPAIYYGRGKKNIALALDYNIFNKVFAKAGESTVIELHVADKKIPVLVCDVQYNPVTDKISHVDFRHVDMETEITARVPVKLVGLAPAVKNLGGILTTHKHEITIKCLPKHLIPVIEVDVGSLEDFHSSIHIRDLKAPAEVKIIDNAEDAVANVRPPKIEEEKKPEAAPAEGAAVAPAEGAAAPAGAPGAPQAPAAAAPVKEEKKR